MIKKLIPLIALALLGMLTVPTAAAQSGVTFIAQNTTAEVGDQITLNVTVDGFNDVVTLQGTLKFDDAVLSYVGTGSYGVNGLAANNFGAPGTGSVPSDRITYSWFEPSVLPVSLGNGSVLFSVTFDVIGGAGGATSLEFVGSPTSQEVVVDDGGTLTTVTFTGQNGQVTVETTEEPEPSPRVSDGLQVLYTFDEGSGSVVHDVSGVGSPLNLSFTEGTPTWIGGAVSIGAPTTIASGSPATKVIDAVKATGEITVEAWVKPANTSQDGPARIVSLSENADPDGGNFMLGQDDDQYRARFRSSFTDQFGKPSVRGESVLTSQVQHVVFTRKPNGERLLYIDGVVEGTLMVGGDLTSWGNFVLSLANEAVGERRPWLGEMHLVAIYNKALSQAEITQNFEVGPDGSGAAAPQYSLDISTSGSGSVTVSPQKSAYDENEQVTLTAVPSPGWEFTGWSGDLAGSTNPTALVMNDDKSVVANFAETQAEQFTLTTNTTGSGSITVTPLKTVYDDGEQVSLTAVPAPGWVFDGWSGDLTGLANPAALVMDADKSVTASFSEAEPSDFDGVLLLTETGQDPVTLQFGTAADATDGTDGSYDAILPPPAHTGFDARFTCMDGTACTDDLSRDIRKTIGGDATIVWQFDFRREGPSNDVVVDWSGSSLPAGAFHLMDRDGLDVDMTQQTSYTVTDPAVSRLLVVYTTASGPVSTNIDVASEWNLLGPPLFVPNHHYQNIYSNAADNLLYGFDQTLGYTSESFMALGRGYWVYFDAAGTEVVSGYPVDAVTLNMVQGWQLISGPSCAVDVGDFVDVQNILVPGSLFGVENGAYVALTTLDQGQAAWIKTSEAGVVSLPCVSAAKNDPGATMLAGTLSQPEFALPIQVSDGTRTTTFTIGVDGAATDGFDANFDQMAPPPPPTGILDARVRGDRTDYFTDIRAAGGAQEFTIRFQPSAGRQGVTLTWNPAGLSEAGEFVITDGAGFTQPMNTTSSLNTANVSSLRSGLTITMQPSATVGYEDGSQMPDQFALRGNFPNPFNPSTQVVVDLPAAAQVSVSVYDVMGRRVLAAPETRLSAGPRQSLALDASSLSSGTYVYRVLARLDGGEARTASGLMTLLK